VRARERKLESGRKTVEIERRKRGRRLVTGEMSDGKAERGWWYCNKNERGGRNVGY
jgi:hypothetical protein